MLYKNIKNPQNIFFFLLCFNVKHIKNRTSEIIWTSDFNTKFCPLFKAIFLGSYIGVRGLNFNSIWDKGCLDRQADAQTDGQQSDLLRVSFFLKRYEILKTCIYINMPFYRYLLFISVTILNLIQL